MSSILKQVRFFARAAPPQEKTDGEGDDARSPAGSDYSKASDRFSSSRSHLGSVRQQCDIFSITNDPATEFEEAPAPVPPSVRVTWRVLAALALTHTVLLLVNVVLLFGVDTYHRKGHQQALLFSLLMLTNLVLVMVMAMVVVRQNKAITQCGICCSFWTAFAYFVILAYNSLDDPLSMSAGRTCLTVIILTLVELATLTVYFVLRFIRYKKVVELYNCRACTCDKACGAAREARLGVADLWPRHEAAPQEPHHRNAPSYADTPVETPARESPISDLPASTHYM